MKGSTTYAYDNNGNTLTAVDGGNITLFGYSAKNELVSTTKAGTTTSFLYNASGIRTGKTQNSATTNFVVDENRDYAQVLLETGDSTSTRYTYGDDLLSQTRNGETNYFHYDGLGSTRALSDVAGVVTDRYDYAAFGEGLNQSGATENRYRFTGEQFDETLNQYYLRARYYNQNIGRFTQQDTYQGNNFDPATLHKYLYANADPSNKIDPSGHMSLGSLMAGINVQAILVNTAVGVPSFAIGFAAGDGVLNAGIPHVYEEENEVCTKSPAPNDPCNFDNVYQGLLRYPAPFMFGGDPVYDGKETTLVLFRTVRHSVSRGRVVNTTMPNHLLYPGYVDRTVEESGNSISVRTYGEGSGAFPLLNTYFSDPLWSSVDRQIRNYVSGSYF